MKLLFLTNLYPPYIVGGAETYLERLVRDLAEIGNEIVVITTAPYSGFQSIWSPQVERQGRVIIYRVFAPNLFHGGSFPQHPSAMKFLWRGFSYASTLSATPQIHSIIAKERPDIINTQNLQGFSANIAIMLKKCRIPIIHTIHDYFWVCPRLSLLHRNGKICSVAQDEVPGRCIPPRAVCKLYRNIQKRLVNGLFCHVIAPSAFALKLHQSEGFFSKIPGSVLPLGSTFLLQKTPPSRNNKPISLLYIGGLSRAKGVDILLKAFRHVKRNDVRLNIAGSGELAEQCRTLSHEDDRVSYHSFVSGSEKEKLFANSDCLVLPSIWYDNSPVVIYESFSWGMPVIASRIGGIPELVHHNYNGLLIPPGDIGQLSKEIENITDNHQQLIEMSRHALDSANNYVFTRHVNGLMKIYKSVMRTK